MANGTDEAAVRKNLADFSTAVLKKDRKTLEKLIGDTVVYSHSNGKAETKAEALAAFDTAMYEKFEFGNQTVQIYGGDTAVVRGNASIVNTTDGKKQALQLSILQVWVKNAGKGWQMVARQSTRLP